MPARISAPRSSIRRRRCSRKSGALAATRASSSGATCDLGPKSSRYTTILGTVVALAGQVGGAKLAEGLYRLRGRNLAVIVNTGDDYEHLGLAFSPDLDTLLYTLGGIASTAAGW